MQHTALPKASMGTTQLGMAGKLPICLLAVQPWGSVTAVSRSATPYLLLGQEAVLFQSPSTAVGAQPASACASVYSLFWGLEKSRSQTLWAAVPHAEERAKAELGS